MVLAQELREERDGEVDLAAAGLQISPFWISESRKTETPRASLAPYRVATSRVR